MQTGWEVETESTLEWKETSIWNWAPDLVWLMLHAIWVMTELLCPAGGGVRCCSAPLNLLPSSFKLPSGVNKHLRLRKI